MSWAMVGAMVSTHHNLVGLARVSTVVQDAQLQRDALTSNEWCHRHASRHPLTGTVMGCRSTRIGGVPTWKRDGRPALTTRMAR